jgi:predicted DNA-binding protein
MLGDRTMTDQEEQSLKEIKRKEKRIEEETEGLAREQGRKKAYLIREEAIEETLKAKKTKRTEKHTTEDIEQLARDQTRKKAYFAKEQAMAEAQEARKLKAQKGTPPE